MGGGWEGKAASEDHPREHLGSPFLGNSRGGILLQGRGDWGLSSPASMGQWMGLSQEHQCHTREPSSSGSQRKPLGRVTGTVTSHRTGADRA